MRGLRRAAALALALAAPLGAAETPLTAVVERALARSAALEAAGERTRQAEAALRESRARRLPALTARTAWTRGDDPVYAFSSLLQQRSFSQSDFAIDALNRPGYRTNIKSSLELGVPLFTALELGTGAGLARLSRDAALSAETGAQQAARYGAVEAHVGALAALRRLSSLRARESSAAEMLADARRLRERGLVLGSDYEAAEAILAGLRAARVRAESELAARRAALAILTGTAPGELEPAGSLAEASCPAAETPAPSREDLARRPDLRQAALTEDAARLWGRQASASLLPRVEAFAALETDTRDFGSNPASRLVGVRASLPLGDPSYPARRGRARAAAREASAARRAAEEAAELELARAREECLGAARGLPELKSMRERSAKALELFRPLYRAGRQSVLEVLRAEEGAARAESAYLDGLSAAHLSWARLLLAAGALDAAAVASLERRLEGTP